jgi:hypothetical protein
MSLHTLSLRVPEDVYKASVEIARKRKVSFNVLVQEELQRMIREDHDREMYEAGTILGEDPDMCDVSYAVHAQAEVMLRDEA